MELLRQDKVEWLKDAALQTTRQWLVSTVLVQPTWWLYDKAVGTEKTIGPSSQFVFLPLLDVRPPSLAPQRLLFCLSYAGGARLLTIHRGRARACV